MPRKPSQGSPRAKLGADLITAFQRDFAENGNEVIERMRQEAPAKYTELAAKLIAPESDPPSPNSFKDAQSMHDIGLRLLRSIGVSEPSDAQITLAIAAIVFISTLEKIRDDTTNTETLQ
jgi:hypothetical protein